MTTPTKITPTLEALRERRDEILRLAEQYGASNVRVFGSVARGEATADSDVDLLVDFGAHSLLHRIALKRELSELMGYPVEVVQEKMLKEYVRPQVLRDVIEL